MESGKEASLSAESDVMNRVTNSRGVVGPGNWAESWYTVIDE